MHIKKTNYVILFLKTLGNKIKLGFQSVTTKKGKRLRNLVICIIVIALGLSLFAIVSNLQKTDTFSSPDNTKLKYLDEKNSSKVQLTYSSKEKKEAFVALAEDTELKIVNYYMNTISKSNSEEVYASMNKELKKDSWKSINMKKPKEWIGDWSVNLKTGEVGFKFLNKAMEPSWIEDADASKYVIKN